MGQPFITIELRNPPQTENLLEEPKGKIGNSAWQVLHLEGVTKIIQTATHLRLLGRTNIRTQEVFNDKV